MLDPQKFCRGVAVHPRLRDAVMVRRLKTDLKRADIDEDIPDRKVVRIDVDGLPEDAPELALSRLLQRYRRAREKRLKDATRSKQASAMLVVTSLQKRLLSSIEAFARTLKVHRDSMARQAEEARTADEVDVGQLPLLAESAGADDERSELPEQEVEAEEDAQMAAASQLETALAGSDRDAERVMTFHGGIGEERREAIKAAFNTDPARHPLRILIATDAAREGVNLQNHCADLFHFDIPWNPSRMEQRNGRIDRKLQRQPEVRCHYYVLPQRAEDRVLDVLVAKTARIHRELGSLSPVVERRLDRMLAGGIRHEQVTELTGSIETVDQERPRKGRARMHVIVEELEESRERDDKLDAQLKRLDEMLRVSQQWIGLDDRHFRDALSAALEIMGAEGLEPLDPSAAAHDPATARWTIPALHRRDGADPTWAATLDSLRAPRKKGQKPWDWRREAPIRPVVFRDPGTLDGEVVHLHLEHRLVQRLLGRFLSQGFLHDELTRACVVRTDDPIPRVVALGRLSLYGEGASRLHDEIVAVAAEWSQPSSRGRGKLRPLGEGAKEDVLRLLEDALAAPRLRKVPSGIRERLRTCAAQDVAELQDHLERRADTLADRAQRELAKRGEKEAEEMRAILEAQRERIVKHQRQVEDDERQLKLELYSTDEQRQLAADKRHWASRLGSLERELVEEPARVRATYEIKARRVEPAGLVYLWPVSR